MAACEFAASAHCFCHSIWLPADFRMPWFATAFEFLKLSLQLSLSAQRVILVFVMTFRRSHQSRARFLKPENGSWSKRLLPHKLLRLRSNGCYMRLCRCAHAPVAEYYYRLQQNVARVRVLSAPLHRVSTTRSECVRLFNLGLQLPLEVGRVDADFLKSCEKGLRKLL
jgi:hypothetical protein